MLLLFIGGMSVGPGHVSATSTAKLSDLQRRPWSRTELLHRIEKLDAMRVAESDDASAILIERARCELLLDNTVAALANLREAASLASSSADRQTAVSASAILAALHFRNGESTEGSLLLDRLQEDPAASQNFDILLAAAERARSDRQFDASISIYRQAADVSSSQGDLHGRSEALLEAAFDLMAAARPLESLDTLAEVRNGFVALDDRRGLAQADIAAAHAKAALSDHAGAMQLYRSAAKGFPNDIDSHLRGTLLSGLAHVYEELGDLDAALVSRQDSIASFKTAGDRFAAFVNLSRLARLRALRGETVEANAAFEEVGSLADGIDPYTRNLNAIFHAEMLIASGDHRRSLEILLRSEPYFQDARLDRELAMIYRLKGMIALANEDSSAAIPLLRKALEVFVSIKDHLSASDVEYLLAKSFYSQGQSDLAYPHLINSVDTGKSIVDSLQNSRARKHFLSQVSERYEMLIDHLMSGSYSNASSDKALLAAEERKARSIVESIVQQGSTAIPNSHDPKIGQALLDLHRAKDSLASLLASSSDENEKAKASERVTSIELQLEEFIAERASDSRLQNLRLAKPAISEMQAQLSRDEVFLVYALTSEQGYLWLLSNSGFEGFKLGSRTRLEALIATLIEAVQSRAVPGGESIGEHRRRIAEADASYAESARELSNVILGPVAEKIKGKRLIVVPDGKLNYFPISALPMPGAESDDPILLTNEVIYQPSAQTYALLKKIGQERKDEQTKDLLVFSDPVFNPSDERLTGIEVAQTSDEPYRFRLVESFSSLSRLPSSKTEAEMVSNAVGSADLFLGFDATRERLLSTNLADYKVVHLATHGFLDPERPELSSLVLSRYDRSGKPIDESIRMHDIYSMKLNADLVVLSACQTGTGKEIKGEGVMGLNTAFLQAGARSVVSTLWQVEDNAANELMKEFYGRMVSEGMSPSAALRAAQIKLYNDPQFRSPFFWAAFTVHGDAATSTPFKRDNSRSVIGVAAAVLLALVVLVFGRRYRTSNA